MALALSAGAAQAHGRPPQPMRLAFDPNDPDRIVVAATFGLVVSTDGGASWRWICAASFGVDPVQEDPDLVVSDDGGVVLATFDGIVRSSSDLCSSEPAAGEVQDVFVIDLAPDPARRERLWALVSSGVQADRVMRSDDGGASWSAVGAPIEGILTERILVAPSDPSRVYVSASDPDPRTPAGFLLRSDDGGETFPVQVEIPVVSGERQAQVLAVDPTNPDRVFVRIARGEVDPRPERMLLSTDGGETFESILEVNNMRSLALSEDGRTVWIGSGLNQGLWRASGGSTEFEQVSDVNPLCLAARADGLWVCDDQRAHGFALGRSTDGGAAIERVLGFEEASELLECPRCTAGWITCPAWVPDLRADLATYFGGADAGMTGLPRDAGIPAECLPDGGTAPPRPPPPPPAAGCGCRVTSSASPPWIALLGLGLVALRTRRRGRS